MTFGEKLQTLRAREGLSQDALAEALDVSRQAVSKWERDEAMPEAEKICASAAGSGSPPTTYCWRTPRSGRPPGRYRSRGKSGGNTVFCWAGLWRYGAAGAASGWCRRC